MSTPKTKATPPAGRSTADRPTCTTGGSSSSRLWLSKAEAARMLRVRRSAIDTLLDRGLLRGLILNGQQRVTRASVEQLGSDPPDSLDLR